MTAAQTAALPASDEQLWQRSRSGDRAAFGAIVTRYQTLVCSIAYTVCGSLARSEDLAQETFVAAWQRLGDLREPTRLKSWLCGIARNLAANSARRERRRGGAPESLDSVIDTLAGGVDPADAAVTAEEEALLWRSLESLPETYRETLVLYYREGESAREVGRALDLSEDAVKQRLSRGRALLRDEIATRVESTLARTRPTIAFTLAVLGALPAAAPLEATAAVIKGAASGLGAGAAKSMLASVGKWAFIGPAIGLAVALMSSRAAASTARSPAERASILRHSRRIIAFAWTMSLGLALVMSQAGTLYAPSAVGIVTGVLLWTIALVGTIAWGARLLERDVARIRAATGTESDPSTAASRRFSGPLVYRSRHRLLGLPLIDVASGDVDPGSFRSRRAIGWIACGDLAISPLFAFGGLAIAPLAIGGVTIGMISLSLWGIAFGLVALGSIAVGWWAFGLAAIGGEGAAGIAVVARDYAIGIAARAAEANTEVAAEWFAEQWFMAPVAWFVYSAHWIVLAIVIFVLGRMWLHSRARSRGDVR